MSQINKAPNVTQLVNKCDLAAKQAPEHHPATQQSPGCIPAWQILNNPRPPNTSQDLNEALKVHLIPPLSPLYILPIVCC